jgi:hypothetical protein
MQIVRNISTAVLVLLAAASAALAQDSGNTVPLVKQGGNPKMKMLSHVSTGTGLWRAATVEMEQEPTRPYVYVSGFTGYNVHIFDVRKPGEPKEVFTWTIEEPALHQGIGAMDGKYFKTKGRYYYVQTFQFTQAGPDADLGAVVFDVTGLPDGSKVKEVARIRYPKAPGGFHNSYAYKHSDGRALLFTHVNAPQSNVYDLDKVVAGGDPETWLISAIPNPTPSEKIMAGGYHDFFVGYDVATGQDKFYGAGLGGFSVFDITKVEDPKLLFTITGNGVQVAHTFTPTPDHKFAVTEIEYQYTPLKIYDLQPANEGRVKNITMPISAWTADWHDLPHNHEVRWPYVFVSAYEDGLQVFEMRDPKHPKTVGWWYTCNCEHETGFGGNQANGFQGTSVMNGAFAVDVRNYDGLIAIADMKTGLWLFKMDGFNSWNGNDYNMPNISSVQDWDNGPVKQAAMKRPAT